MESSTAKNDERLLKTSVWRNLLNRPELGSAGGVIIIWLFFAFLAGDRGFLSLRGTATYLEVAAELGILAIGVSLLMIGGEFDLSIGSIIGACGMCVAILSGYFQLPLFISMPISLLLAITIGFINGYIVVRTGLPSFIITLGMLFIIRGTTIGVTRAITGRTQIGELQNASGYAFFKSIFTSEIMIQGAGFSIAILWWLAIAVLATWVLLRTRFGNWIFGVGGDPLASKMVGVPVDKVKIKLFITTAICAWLVAMIQALEHSGADVLRGQNREFFAIIAVVIGGTLLTGGYGSAIGAVLGALIFGMVRQGIVFTGIDADWFQVVLGTMLVIAVLTNNYVRHKAAKVKV